MKVQRTLPINQSVIFEYCLSYKIKCWKLKCILYKCLKNVRTKWCANDTVVRRSRCADTVVRRSSKIKIHMIDHSCVNVWCQNQWILNHLTEFWRMCEQQYMITYVTVVRISNTVIRRSKNALCFWTIFDKSRKVLMDMNWNQWIQIKIFVEIF